MHAKYQTAVTPAQSVVEKGKKKERWVLRIKATLRLTTQHPFRFSKHFFPTEDAFQSFFLHVCINTCIGTCFSEFLGFCSF